MEALLDPPVKITGELGEMFEFWYRTQLLRCFWQRGEATARAGA